MCKRTSSEHGAQENGFRYNNIYMDPLRCCYVQTHIHYLEKYIPWSYTSVWIQYHDLATGICFGSEHLSNKKLVICMTYERNEMLCYEITCIAFSTNTYSFSMRMTDLIVKTLWLKLIGASAKSSTHWQFEITKNQPRQCMYFQTCTYMQCYIVYC